MNNRNLDIEALFSVPSISAFDISNKGDKFLISSNRSKRWQLYVGDLANPILGSNQLTFDSESKVGAKFLPDGERILYASDRQGDEKFNLYLYNLKTKGVRDLTPGTEFAIYPNATISKDSRKIAYVSNQSDAFASYVLDAETLESTRMSNHKFSDSFATISPDGRWVAFSSAISGQDSGLFLGYVENPERETLKLLDEGGVQIDADQPVWSPDSTKVSFVSSSKGWYDIGLWDFSSNVIRWLTRSDREYYEPTFSEDGKKIAYLVNSGGDIKLVVHELDKDDGEVIEFRHGVVSSPKFSRDGESIFFLFNGPRNPTDLWQYIASEEKFLQLTSSLPETIDVNSFVEGEQIIYPNKKDETRVPALIYMPNRSSTQKQKKTPKQLRGKDTRENLPMVVEIHGGPTSQSLNMWDPFVQALVAKGIVVLRPNYRGSTGYGKKFREANRFVMGDLDLADCVSGRDFLVERGVVDTNRVAVTGGSFGGYLTMCSVTKYPDLWTCGAALVPFLNWFTEIKNEREDLRYWDLQNMGDPDKEKERLREASPIFFIDKIKAPVLLIAGAHDPRCPLEESEQARDELLKLGKPVEFKAYMDEGHGFRKMENRVDAYKRTIAFLEEYLLKKGNTPS